MAFASILVHAGLDHTSDPRIQLAVDLADQQHIISSYRQPSSYVPVHARSAAPCSSIEMQAAIEIEDLAGDETGHGRDEECDAMSEFLRLAEAADRNLLQ